MKITIKTADGNRLEMTAKPDYVHQYGRSWLAFPVPGGTKYVSLDQVVSISEKEDS